MIRNIITLPPILVAENAEGYFEARLLIPNDVASGMSQFDLNRMRLFAPRIGKAMSRSEHKALAYLVQALSEHFMKATPQQAPAPAAEESAEPDTMYIHAAAEIALEHSCECGEPIREETSVVLTDGDDVKEVNCPECLEQLAWKKTKDEYRDSGDNINF